MALYWYTEILQHLQKWSFGGMFAVGTLYIVSTLNENKQYK